SMSRHTSTSVATTYSLVILTSVISLVGLLAPQSFSQTVLQYMFVINPVVSMLSEVALPSLKDNFQIWLPNIYFLLIGTVVFLFASAFRVYHLVKPR
ncbi:MAG: hypothetical protein ACOC0A_02145, partial [Planctomycetota bacterium]